MKILTLCLLLWCAAVQAQTYTEFWVQTTATNGNFNSGSTSDDTPTFAAASGNWTNATGVWFKSGAVTAAVTNGAWASVFVDGTTTNTWFVGLITNVDLVNNRVWISLVANAGTKPSDQVGTATIRVGGAWSGPNTNQNPSIQFPWGFMAGSLTNDPSHFACVNIKTNIYTWTNAIVQGNVGAVPFRISGYGSTPRDGIMAVMDGTSLNGSWVPITVSGNYIYISDLIWVGNGASGTATGPVATGNGQMWRHCSFSKYRSNGFTISGNSCGENLEFYQNNGSGTSSAGGFSMNALGATLKNSISHDNSAANSIGIALGSGALINVIVSSNNNNGITCINGSSGSRMIMNCDIYTNGASGIDFSGSTPVYTYIANCNFLANGAYGINNSGGQLFGDIEHCGFGSGSQTNFSGNIISKVQTSSSIKNTVTYSAGSLPWVAPTTGNFSITLAAAKSSGYGTFTYFQTNSLTVGYPDIGAAQASDTNSASGGGAYTFSQ